MADLKGKQNKFMLSLLKESTTEEAIESSGIARNTAYKYLRDPTFQQVLRESRNQSIMIVTQKLSNAGEEAVSTLMEILKDKDAPASSRVSASRTVLEFLYRGYENDELLERIEALEGLVDE